MYVHRHYSVLHLSCKDFSFDSETIRPFSSLIPLSCPVPAAPSKSRHASSTSTPSHGSWRRSRSPTCSASETSSRTCPQTLGRLSAGEKKGSGRTKRSSRRARNLARVLEDRARLAAECLPAALVQKGLGVSRQRLHQLVKAGRLVAVLTKDWRSSLYPAWQFAADGTPLPGLAAVIAAAHAAEMDAETLHFFMGEPDERLGGGTPADLLAAGEGDRVATLLRSVGLGPFSG